MFHAVRNMYNSGTLTLRDLAEELSKRLPRGWSVQITPATSRRKKLLELKAPNGVGAAVAIEERKRVIPRELPGIVKAAAEGGLPVLLFAPFLGPRSREVLIDLRANYADATGNMRVALDRPTLFIETQGADRDPVREARPLKSLKGSAAGRVVRALCDFLPPYGVRNLAEASSTPLGTVSRVFGLLDREALVKRDDRKRIVEVEWQALLRRWSRDYDLKTSNQLSSFLEPRGLNVLVEKLSRWSGRYAVTGSLAGPRIAAPRLAAFYIDDASQAADRLGLTPTDAGANVWLLEPFDDVVFDRTQAPGFAAGNNPDTKLVCAAPSQVSADLMTSPGRGPQEAEALIDKMEENEKGWRRGL